MHTYYKAYLLKELRQFSSWCNEPITMGEHLNDESVVYLRDDYVVVTNPFAEEEILFITSNDSWLQFCHEHLSFKEEK